MTNSNVLWQVVFSVVLVVYTVLVILTVSAVREVPLDHLDLVEFAGEDGKDKSMDYHGAVSSK